MNKIQKVSIEEKNNKDDARTLAKPLFTWFLILFAPSSIAVYFFVDSRLGLAIFLGMLFSAFGSVFLVSVFLYEKGDSTPIIEKQKILNNIFKK